MAHTIWFTGLPCSGKTTLAKAFAKELRTQKEAVVTLDGDDVREGLCYGLGFTQDGRHENLSRIAHVAQLAARADVWVVASFITPLREFRYMIQGIIPNVRFVHVKCSAEECRSRDVKGMWAKAEQGKIVNFTGVSAPYEEPQEEADLVLDTQELSIDQCVEKLKEQYYDWT